MSKTNNETTIEAMNNTIAEMNETIKALAEKIAYLEKNAQMKQKPYWPTRNTDHCVMNPVIDKSTGLNILSNGIVYVRTGDEVIKNAIRKIHEADPEAITPVNSKQRWMEDYEVFQNMKIKSGILLKDWLDDYSEPDKDKWLDNNYTYTNNFGQIVDKRKRQKYAEYYTTNGNDLTLNETTIRFNPEAKYYEWTTTDDRIKSYIMQNEDEFKFIRHVTDENNNIIQWIVRTSEHSPLIQGLFENLIVE